ncbi:MAG: 30S ribosomal protein S6--L-glutamate ligase [bacterium]|nr:30S ribosomal protein S6--L-glutamate ligase [bacterium]
MTTTKKKIIGSEEWCKLGKLGIPAIKARVDSGAKTSTIHAYNIRPYQKDAVKWVSFEIHPLQNDRKTIIRCDAKVVDRRDIKSSSGAVERRYVIKTLLTMGKFRWDVELTLTNRDSMGYRMLLGREAMKGRLIVDPAEKFIMGGLNKEAIKKLYVNINKPASGLKIALLASNPKLYSNQRIIEAGEQRGHNMSFLNIKQCYMKVNAEAPEIHNRGGKIISGLNAIVPRIKPAITFYGAALTRHFESIGVKTINTAQAITQSRDKLFSLQLLQQSGIEIPTTGFASSPIDTDDLINMVGGAPLIVKLLEGTQGTGVVLAETKKAAESVINAFKSLKANLLVQEFIKESGGEDIRCFVVNGRVVGSMKRTAAAGEFRANVHKGASVESIKITPEERKIAVKAAKVMGLDVAGVDIIRSNKGPLLLEVNSSPGLEGIEEATGKDIAREIIIAIEKKCNWKIKS